MARVTVEYRGELQSITGKRREPMDAAAVRDVLKAIGRLYGKQPKKTAETMLIAVDNESILLRQGYATPLKDGETVSFFPNCGGG